MAIQSKPVRPRAVSRPRTVARAWPTRGRRESGEAASAAPPRAGEPRPRSPEIVPRSSGAGELSRGDSLFLVFFVATMIMVIAVMVVGAVGQMWVLVPVMLVDLTVTFALIATLVSMLGGDGGTPE